MSNEAQVHCYLYIKKDNLEYRSQPQSFYADVATGKGPVPGAFQAVYTGTGTQIDFTNLTTPAVAIIRNFDDSNYVEFGVVVSSVFYPIIEVQAGEFYPIRFARGASLTSLYIRANTANCEVSVEAFEA